MRARRRRDDRRASTTIVRALPPRRRAPPRRAGDRGRRSTATPARRATRSATRRSPRPASTPRRCTGSATTAGARRASWCSSTPGVEVDSLYTADVTRTLPGRRRRSPRCSAASTRRCSTPPTPRSRSPCPGARFRDVHAAAMEVIAARLAEWGLLPVTRRGVAAARRTSSTAAGWCTAPATTWASTCTTARRPARELYLDGVLEPGMVFTIEPGLYFKADDLLVPAGVPRHRRADRGRRAGHRGRQREPLGGAPPRARTTSRRGWRDCSTADVSIGCALRRHPL